jgi:glycogen synthase
MRDTASVLAKPSGLCYCGPVVRLLVLTNLYPPHHGGTEDFRCQAIVENLRLRGHETMVLTSLHGMRNERTDGGVARRFMLSGAIGYPLVTSPGDLKRMELHNHAVLREALGEFKPDMVLVFSLHGLSKSLIFGLQHARLPVVYDVADTWLAADLKKDPWLRWWNDPAGNFFRNLQEVTGQRAKLDALAPTRSRPGCDRLPELFGDGPEAKSPAPNSIGAIRFESLYFCSQWLKAVTAEAGFKVDHGGVIPPGIATQNYVGELKPVSVPMQKLLLVGRLNKASGLLTAARALQNLRANQIKASLSVYGKGDSNYIAEARSYIALQRLPVEFLPVSNLQRDLPALFRQHDCLLYSAEEPEPYVLTPLQAMACGLPVIGTAVGGARDILRHGENALTFTPAAADELAARIKDLYGHPELRCKIAETAQTEVLSQFSETVMTDHIEAALENARQMWQAG